MKVGDYVRYKYENCIYIGKIKFISEVMSGLDETLQLDIDNCMEEPLKQDIIKSSPNIIDLIEVGDLIYVDISPDNSGGIIVPRIAETENELNLFKQLLENGWIIKSIITREQLGSIKYKVGE